MLASMLAMRASRFISLASSARASAAANSLAFIGNVSALLSSMCALLLWPHTFFFCLRSQTRVTTNCSMASKKESEHLNQHPSSPATLVWRNTYCTTAWT